MADRVQDLIDKLCSSDRNVVKASVIDDLGNLMDRRAVKPLIQALNDPEMLVRWNAIKALARFGDASVPPLLDALNTEDRFKRRNVVQALGELGGDEAVDHLVRMLMFDESDQMVLIETIRALDKIGDARAVDPLITVLKIDDWEMRYRAIHALDHLGDPKAVEPLLEVMNDPDKDIHWAAYMAIENIKSLSEGGAERSPKAAGRPGERDKAHAKDQLKLSAETLNDRVVIAVEGDLVYENVTGFTGYIDGVISVSKTDIELAMDRCAFVDSFALSRLHALRKKLKAKNRSLTLTGLRPNVKAVFSATKLDQVFEIK